LADDSLKYSLIAVTGLAGDAYGSWKRRESQRMWLKDFLPRDLKQTTNKKETALISVGVRSDVAADYCGNILWVLNEFGSRALPIGLSNE
jgi:hypothetical protein